MDIVCAYSKRIGGYELTPEELIKENLPLIKHIAQNFYNVSFEDLLQAGAMGILKAYKKYRQNGTTKFSTYAYDYIFGEMYDFAMKDRKLKISKDLVRLAKKVELAKNALSQKMNRIPTYEEIASFLDLTPLQIREALLAVNECMSLDDERENERSLYETIPDKESLSIDEKLTLESSIERLSDSEQKIIRYRYFRDLSQSETAKRLGMTQVMVSRYEKKSLERLKKYYEVV